MPLSGLLRELAGRHVEPAQLSAARVVELLGLTAESRAVALDELPATNALDDGVEVYAIGHEAERERWSSVGSISPSRL